MLVQPVVKVALTALLVVAVSEVGKHSTIAGAVLASLPLTSLLAFVWLYAETGDVQKIAALSHGIFWLVLASLPLFLILPALLNAGSLLPAGLWLMDIRLPSRSSPRKLPRSAVASEGRQAVATNGRTTPRG